MAGKEETLKFLSALSEDDLKEFLYSCMDELCGKKGPAVVNAQSRTPLSGKEFKEVVANTNALCCECIELSMDLNELKEKYPALSQSQCSVIHACVANRKNEMMHYVNLGLLGKSDYLLKDYDWKLKWVIGSSTFSAMHEPLLALDLNLESGKGSTAMNLELDKTELKQLIEALEKAQQSMFSRLTSA